MPKVRKAELTFLYATHPLILFYISTKYNQNIQRVLELQSGHEINFKTKQRGITPKVRKPELSLLYVKHCLILFYIATKYHKNIPKGI